MTRSREDRVQIYRKWEDPLDTVTPICWSSSCFVFGCATLHRRGEVSNLQFAQGHGNRNWEPWLA